MAKIEKAPTGEFHSGYGCVIMSAAVGVFGFIVFWMFYYVPMTLDKQIAAVAQESPAVLPEIAPVAGLTEKLALFTAAVQKGERAVLKLSVAEMNALLNLAPDAKTGGYATMLRVKGLDAAKGLILTDVSLPMNTAKFWEEKKRYLVGEIDFKLEQTELGPDVKVSTVRVPGKTIPEEMIKGMQMYGYCGPYHNDATLGVLFKSINEVKVEAEALVVVSGGR